MGDLLDFQQAPIRLEASLAQFVEIAEPLSDIEVSCIIDGRLCAQGLSFFVILLDARALVVDAH